MRMQVVAAAVLIVGLLAGCAPPAPVSDGPPVEPGDPCNGVPPQICPAL